MSYQRRSYHHPWNAGGRDGRVTPALSTLPPDRSITEGLDETPIKIIAKPVSSRSGGSITVKDLQYIGSYNWVNTTKPMIIVPGSPPEWRNRELPFTVPRDTGTRYVDQNGYRMPSCTLYPLFRAVDIVSVDNDELIDWARVDFVTDRNGLRKLLRWIDDVDGSAKEFRIDTQLAGTRTVLFNRWEKHTREDPDPTRASYGFSFERESTNKVKGCEQSTGHHRIVKYDFDGLTMVVRFEVDACIAPVRNSATRTTNVDSLSDMLSGLDFNSTSRPTVGSQVDDASSTKELSVIRAGSQVAQHAIIEMCTRNKNYADQFDWNEAYPQLFFSQTQIHYLAMHHRGTIIAVKKDELGNSQMRSVDASMQDSFKRLRRVLGDIQKLVIKHGEDGRLSLVQKGGELQVFERKTRDSYLPPAMLKRFEA